MDLHELSKLENLMCELSCLKDKVCVRFVVLRVGLDMLVFMSLVIYADFSVE